MMAWLFALPHPIKIIIAGNRDFILDREWYDANWAQTGRHGNEATWEPPESVFELLTGPSAVAANIVYLQDQPHKFRARPGGREWTVYGSPVLSSVCSLSLADSPSREAPTSAVRFARSPTMRRMEKVRMPVDILSPKDEPAQTALMAAFPSTDILLTHCPPHNILDVTNKADRAGCSALAARLSSLRPRLHVFGHIHEARGAHVHLWARGDEPSTPNNAQTSRAAGPDELIVEEGEQTVFVNAANYPSGPNVPREYGRVDAGGVGFQPIVVDLLD
ncbi:hypothetical protein B0H14DRAFT_1192853 [Mycena olivaceomarginata]|nr:hypothetical protein B0H14DRAFT_1192853 [Mycena olivaceomarginata]